MSLAVVIAANIPPPHFFVEDGLDDIYQRLQTTQESFLRARSPTMTLLDQVYERFVGRDYNNKDVWQTLKANPTFLTTIPTNKQWTILHHIVQQDDRDYMERVMRIIPVDLRLAGTDGVTLKTLMQPQPKMSKLLVELEAFEEVITLSSTTWAPQDKDKAQQRAEALLAHFRANLRWLSNLRHKEWAPLHYLVHHGDVDIIDRLLRLPNNFARFKPRTLTKNCRRDVFAIARDNAALNPHMNDYIHRVVAPLFNYHPTPLPSSPMGRVKHLYFIRHAHGYHNLAGETIGFSCYDSWEWADAELTPQGRDQCEDLRQKMTAKGCQSAMELVVVSPLKRTLDTATLALPPRQGLRFVALECARESLGLYPCNWRNPVSTYTPRWDHVDFSQIATDEDQLFDKERDESLLERVDRAHYLLSWISHQPETHVAVVSHGDFLFTMFEQVLQPNTAPVQYFSNCEMRDVAIYLP